MKPKIGQHPLDWIVEFALSIRAQSIMLCKYDVTENYNIYRRDRHIIHPKQAQICYAQLLAEAAGAYEEVGICSSFLGAAAEENHFVFADFDDEELESLKTSAFSLARSSEKGFHGYTPVWRDKFYHVQSELLREYPVDKKWIACGIQRGFNVLRLSKLTERFKKEAPLAFTHVPT